MNERYRTWLYVILYFSSICLGITLSLLTVKDSPDWRDCKAHATAESGQIKNPRPDSPDRGFNVPAGYFDAK